MHPSLASALSFCEITGDGETTRFWSSAESAVLAWLEIGQTLAQRYVLVAELGTGGMGRVYLARDLVLDRDVALKVSLLPSHPRSVELPDLVAEGQLAALVNHPSIASVYDSGIHEGQSFTIFEYVDGSNLRHVMATRSPSWPVEDVLSVLRPLAEALDFAHARGVVHSDLKPENICIARSGAPKILDFGIAARLHAGQRVSSFMGTPAYASPEQAALELIDGRSDQYALALIVFELLCGRRPFIETTPALALLARVKATPPSVLDFRDDLPSETASVVKRAMERDPKDRFATCREFAAAMEASMQSRRWGGAFERRTDLHLIETQAESLVARTLADALEVDGYRVWYYQRDALPGIRLRRQVSESLQSTRVALLLISRNSLTAPGFADEVMEASRLGRPFLPILIDMSLEELEARPPVWRAALGSATIIEYRRDRADQVLDRLRRSLALLDVLPGDVMRRSAEQRKNPAQQTWVTDSNQIDNRDLQRVVFRNEVIQDYLSRPNKYFISAIKGLGKTLLMKYKRHLLTQAAEGQRAVCMIPSGQPYLDFMSEMKLLSRHYDAQLSDLSFCKRMWGVALRVSIISHHGHLISDELRFELEGFPQRMQRWLQGVAVEPSVAFKELTNLAISEANRLIDSTENFLDEQIRKVHAATYVFIDKVDQAVRHLSRGAWIHIQAGLIEAAWDLMSANSHIKVYASIRQEAFANFQSDIKSNLLGATAQLRYTEEELRSLVDQLTSCYEGVESFKDFVGINVVKHPRRPFPEDSFEFCRRYTFGRPRDFVAIAAELSATKQSLDERRYCDVIRQTSALGLVPSLFDENRVFLDCLFERERQTGFLGLLQTNIMTREQAIAISRQFNGLLTDEIGESEIDSSELFHPFRDLYLTGLLGFVRRNDQDDCHQRFRQPSDSFGSAQGDLPRSTHYFIHPALSEYIQHLRGSGGFRIIQQILVGENAAWISIDPIVFQVELALERLIEADLRNQVQEILAEAKVLRRGNSSRSLRSELGASRFWRETIPVLMMRGYDDLVLWLDELLEAS